MFLKNKVAAQILYLTGAVILTGCIVTRSNNNAHYGASIANGQQSSGTSAWDRGCADAKSGSYDRSGNAGQDYEQGWNSCKNETSQNQSSAPIRQKPRAAGAMDELEKRGLKFVRTEEYGDGKFSYWKDLGTGGA